MPRMKRERESGGGNTRRDEGGGGSVLMERREHDGFGTETMKIRVEEPEGRKGS